MVVTSIHSLVFDYFVLFIYTDKDKVQTNGDAFAWSLDEASGQGTLYINGTYKYGKLYT